MKISLQEIIKQLSQQLQPLSDTAQLDAQVLLAHHLDKPRTWILAHPEALVNDSQYKDILQSIKRLEDGESLPYVIGHWEFYGLDFMVTPDVLIPRPETELLVERAIRWLQRHPQKRRAVDIGTGSGCIGIAIAKHIPDVHMMMTDISAAALNVARLNVEKHGVQQQVDIRHSNLLITAHGQFDLICANLPYIPTQMLDTLPVAKREPRLALDGGENGTKLINTLLKQAITQIDSDGLILLEIDPAQRLLMKQILLKNFPYDKITILQDLAGRDRCVEIEKVYRIFHLCQRLDWLKSQPLGNYQAASLAIEGFIHCSQNEQIIAVANRYYKDVPEIVVLTIDPEKLTSEIRWEKSGSEYYPHIYGPINLEAVEDITDIWPESDGIYRNIYSQSN